MTRVELLSQLENCKNNFILTIAGLAAVLDRRGSEILKAAHFSFGGFSIHFDQVVTMFTRPADKDIATKEAVCAAFRTLLKESFELVKSYAEDSGQEEEFKAFPSYRYHRLVRHALSHNFRWDLMTNKNRPYEYLPLEPWRHDLKNHVATIEASMHDQHLTLDQLPFDAMWQLFADLSDDARKSLA